MVKTPPGRWGQHQLAALLGTSGPAWGRYLNGVSYPTLQMMQKIEIVLGWPVREQVDLIPPYWDWPLQGGNGRTWQAPTDLRYATYLRKVVNEWADANPRTVKSIDIRQHPDIKEFRGPRRGGKKYYE